MLESTTLSVLQLIDDHEALARLPAARQQRIASRLQWIARILDAGHGGKGRIVKAAAIALDTTESTVHRYVKRYKLNGWRGVDDGRSATGQSKGLPSRFKTFVEQRHLEMGRSSTGRETWRSIIEQWLAWQHTGDAIHAIDGYSSPPPAGPKGYPTGWSEDQIVALRPDAYACAVARRGAKVASKFLPSIIKTRVGLRYGQVVYFDDQDYDLKVVAPGFSQKTCRPQGFNSVDYLTGDIKHSIRLRYWDSAKNGFRELTQQDFTWQHVAHLQTQGYRSDTGSHHVFEHKTATGYRRSHSAELETYGGHSNYDLALAAVTQDKLTIHRSGLFNKPAFAELMFRPQSSGNPDFKAPVESIFNLVRNRMARLPGPTGRHRDLKPGEIYGLEAYAEQMLKLYDKLPEDRRDLIRYPLLTATQFGQLAESVYQAIASDPGHALEGWDACGFCAAEFRWTPDSRSAWISQQELAELPAALQSNAQALMDLPGHVRPRRLSRGEAARLFKGELTLLPDHLIPLIIPRQWSREATVTSTRTIKIQDQLFGPEPFEYIARIETRDGFETLRSGAKLNCFFNPFLPEKLVVCRPDGSFLGTLHLRTRAHWLDQDAIEAQLKERASITADLNTGVRPHLQPLADKRAADAEHNERLAETPAGLDPEVERGKRTSSSEIVKRRRKDTECPY